MHSIFSGLKNLRTLAIKAHEEFEHAVVELQSLNYIDYCTHSLTIRSIVQEKSQSVNLINLRGHLNQDAGKERKVIFQPQSIMEVENCVPPR